MNNGNFNKKVHKSRVLVAPLDWGLGHSTRCIPIINKLLQQNCEVIIAAEKAGKYVLQQEFPDLVFLDLSGYRIQYSRYKFWMPVKLISQLPKIVYRIYAERRWLNKMVKQHIIGSVISDNRLGLSHKNVHSVYITHQLKIKTGNRFTESVAQKIHYHFINKYKECWVPDWSGENNLAGELSHPDVMPVVPVKYIGPISRFEKTENIIQYDLLILLSGPEPQRTFLENKIFSDLKHYDGKVFILRGLPGETTISQINNISLDIHNHLPAQKLNQVIQQSKLVISRSGYTTVMDLVKLQKRAVLVPTPGQTEQEYLADYLMKQKLFLCVNQDDFSLPEILKKAESFENKKTIWSTDFEKTIEDLITSIP